ncbi:Fe-S cluster assembly protein SufD [Microbacterium sp. STN6]|uniref:Fe-S cluster assembly protein SufD n=1 Tax=Microbacterium sp. STN6 TaxID=2995588 RepID=UPI0022609601|nr:Fe-S cluster assembly protein SufD [Microbacterium sp. STN6]MCX7521618.1 Fe-S cluster assembly protein SufD [Microbacterium sp. STN6]
MSSAATQTVIKDQEPAQHGLKKHSDGGWGLVPVQTRSERFRSVEVADFPAVTGREAVWRNTPVGRIQPLTAGELDGSPYEIAYESTEGVEVSWIDTDDARIGSAGLPEERASANAWGASRKALLVRITGEVDGEFTLTRSTLGTTPRAGHIVIDAAPMSSATVVLRSLGEAQLSENVEIIVGEAAQLTFVSDQEWHDDAVHLASHFAILEKDAKLKHVVVSLGGSIVRVNPSTHLVGAGSDTEMLGVYFADAGQHLEQQVYVFHDAPHSRSRVTYKGALQGEGAHTVWIGDVLIGQKAVGTDSYEQNRNLVLSEGTRADSVPNLEIETGDILGAGHASATGRFDDEQLFYLQSRGITEDEARRLVVRGFLTDVVQKIGAPALQAHLNAAIEAELADASSRA